MKKIIVNSLCLLALLVFCRPVAWAQKIEVDPNTNGSAVEQKVDDSNADERLVQKVTYTATGKRLHTVLEELSAMTGVTIRCGSSDKDWQTRDLPVLVCCKDFPLVSLLKAIAESTHLLLSSYSVSGARSYRIWQDKTREKQLEDFYKTAREAGLANASLEWDSWVKLASIPESELENEWGLDDEDDRSQVRQASRFAKIIAKLGPEAKKRVFAGESVCFSAKDADPGIADAITEIYSAEWESSANREKEYYAEHPDELQELPEGYQEEMFRGMTDEDMQQACLEIRLTQGVYPRLHSSIDGPRTCFSLYDEGPENYSEAIADPPELPEFPISDYFKSLRKIGWDYCDESEDEVEPDVDTESEEGPEFTLEKPKGKKEPEFADVMKALADVSGYAIVCEDFISYKNHGDYYADQFGEKTTLDEVLCNLGWGPSGSMNWYADEQSKLIVGHMDTWYERHLGLVPESLISSLRDKLNGDGCELDDVLPVLRFTPRQRSDWLDYDTDLGALNILSYMEGASLWTFYASLSEQDQKHTRSQSGLPLGKFDPKVVSNVLSRASEYGEMEDPDYGRMGSQCCDSEETETDDILSDPDIIHGLTLHIREGNFLTMMKAQIESDPEIKEQMAQAGIDYEEYMAQFEKMFAQEIPVEMQSELKRQMKKKVYYMQLKGEDFDRSLAFFAEGFPIYSEEREKELEETEKNGKQVTDAVKSDESK